MGVANIYPNSDNTYKCGTTANRWSEVYSANGAINTSDERTKDNINAIDEKVFKAWRKINFKQYQFKDAISKKGDSARIHIGVIAQEIKMAFESVGLDAMRYGLLCYDEWDDNYKDKKVVDKNAQYDSTGKCISEEVSHVEKELVTKAGNLYGVRYNECLALECAYQRYMLDKIISKIGYID
jgi:hypothetical protein